MSTPPLPVYCDVETERLIKHPPRPIELPIDPLVDFLVSYISKERRTSQGDVFAEGKGEYHKYGEASEC